MELVKTSTQERGSNMIFFPLITEISVDNTASPLMKEPNLALELTFKSQKRESNPAPRLTT